MTIHAGVSYQHISSKWHCFVAFQDHKQMFLVLYFTITFTDSLFPGELAYGKFPDSFGM